MGKHYIIPIFVPHLGCPHDCIFCNQRKIASSITDITEVDVENTIERYLSYFKEDSFIEIAFYGGSFTAIDIDIQEKLLKIALQYKENKEVDEIRLSTRPDSINKNILEHLKRYKVDTIELGVQSLYDDVLEKSGRGHTSEDVYRAVELIKKYDFKLGLQMMVGLPGDTIKRSIETAKMFIKIKPQCVRIYPTLVIRDTYLEKRTIEGNYSPLSLVRAVEICSYLLMDFYINKINVIRVGLQPTENIQLGKDVLDGPFHPAFKQLVDSNIYRLALNEFIDKQDLETKGKIMVIYANSKNISNLAGQKSSNINFLKTKYALNKVKLYTKEIDENDIIIKIEDYCDKIDMNKFMREYLDNLEVNQLK